MKKKSNTEELTQEHLEIKRLTCLNLRLRIGMLQVGMESMQKDFAEMQRQLTLKQSEFNGSYEELKVLLECPEGQEINLETGDFIVPPHRLEAATPEEKSN